MIINICRLNLLPPPKLKKRLLPMYSDGGIAVSLAQFYFNMCRWSGDGAWETSNQSSDFGWMQMAEPVMKLYTEATDGSYIETKESALVWHHQDADPGFGSAQAKEMLDHLESVLANEPVSVKSGQFIVEVKPQV